MGRIVKRDPNWHWGGLPAALACWHAADDESVSMHACALAFFPERHAGKKAHIHAFKDLLLLTIASEPWNSMARF